MQLLMLTINGVTIKLFYDFYIEILDDFLVLDEFKII